MASSIHKSRIFHFLVRLFPIEFRRDYERDMEHVFEDQRREAADQGGVMGNHRLW